MQQYQTNAAESTVGVFTRQPSRDNFLYRRDIYKAATGYIDFGKDYTGSHNADIVHFNTGFSAKIEKKSITGREVFNVNLLASFDTDVNEIVITEVAKHKPLYFVKRDTSISAGSVADNFEQAFNAYSKETVRKIL